MTVTGPATNRRTASPRRLVGSVAARGLGAGASVLHLAVVSRGLGPVDFGSYMAGYNLAMVAAVLARQGYGSLYLRTAGRWRAAVEGAGGDLAAYVQLGRRRALAMAAVLAALVGVSAAWLYAVGGSAATMLAVAALLMVPVPLTFLSGEEAKALALPNTGLLAQSGVPQLVATAPLAILYFGPGRLTPLVVATVFAASTLAVHAGTRLVTRRARRTLPRPSEAPPPATGFRRRSVLIEGMTTAQVALVLVVLELGGRSGLAGGIAASQRITGVLPLILVAMNAIIAPELSHQFARGRWPVRTVRRVGLASLAIASPLLGACLVAPATVLRLVAGASFEEFAVVVFALALGQVANLGVGATGTLLLMTGHEELLVRARLVGLAISVAAALLGVAGASAGQVAAVLAAAVAITNGMTYWYSRRPRGGFARGQAATR